MQFDFGNLNNLYCDDWMSMNNLAATFYYVHLCRVINEVGRIIGLLNEHVCVIIFVYVLMICYELTVESFEETRYFSTHF